MGLNEVSAGKGRLNYDIKDHYQLTQIIPAADAGDIQAMYDFIMAVFTYGFEIEESDKDIKDRLWEYSNRIYEAGDTSGLYYMATCYLHGYGVIKDVEKAISLFIRLGEEGDSFGYEYAAKILYEGERIEKNEAEAFSLQTLAGSTKQVPESFLMLGDMYRKGKLVEQDYSESFKLYASEILLFDQLEEVVGKTQPEILKDQAKLCARAKYWCEKYIWEGLVPGIEQNDAMGFKFLKEACEQVSKEDPGIAVYGVTKEMIFGLYQEVFGETFAGNEGVDIN